MKTNVHLVNININKAFQTSKSNLRKVFNLDAKYNLQESENKNLNFDKIQENFRSIIENIYYLNDFSITLIEMSSFEPKIFNYLSEQKFEYK